MAEAEVGERAVRLLFFSGLFHLFCPQLLEMITRTLPLSNPSPGKPRCRARYTGRVAEGWAGRITFHHVVLAGSLLAVQEALLSHEMPHALDVFTQPLPAGRLPIHHAILAVFLRVVVLSRWCIPHHSHLVIHLVMCQARFPSVGPFVCRRLSRHQAAGHDPKPGGSCGGGWWDRRNTPHGCRSSRTAPNVVPVPFSKGPSYRRLAPLASVSAVLPVQSCPSSSLSFPNEAQPSRPRWDLNGTLGPSADT